MTWLVGILSGATGGALALLGGLLADIRVRRNELVDRVQTLGAALLAEANALGNLIHEVQIQRIHDQSVRLDFNRLGERERSFTRAFTELRWLLKLSTIAPIVDRLDQQRTEIVSEWQAPYEKWEPLYSEYVRRSIELDSYLQAFALLSPRRGRKFLRYVVLPTPPPAGFRPARRQYVRHAWNTAKYRARHPRQGPFGY